MHTLYQRPLVKAQLSRASPGWYQLESCRLLGRCTLVAVSEEEAEGVRAVDKQLLEDFPRTVDDRFLEVASAVEEALEELRADIEEAKQRWRERRKGEEEENPESARPGIEIEEGLGLPVDDGDATRTGPSGVVMVAPPAGVAKRRGCGSGCCRAPDPSGEELTGLGVGAARGGQRHAYPTS